MPAETFPSAETGPLSDAELAEVFEEARVMNLIFPQAVQGIAMVMLGKLLEAPVLHTTLRRFIGTRLPESYAETYGDQGTAAHKARGFAREVGALGGAWLWEREKVVLLAILVRVFASREDRQRFNIDSPRIREISRLLQPLIHGRGQFEDGPQFNEAHIAELCTVLAARMKADKEGTDAIRAYSPLFKEALETLSDELATYREGFTAIVHTRDETGDISSYYADLNSHIQKMMERALNVTETVLAKKELPAPLKARLGLLINILNTQYFAH